MKGKTMKKSYITRTSFLDFMTDNRVQRRSGELWDRWYRAIDKVALQSDSEDVLLRLMDVWFAAAQELSPEINMERWGHLTSYGVAVFRNSRRRL